MKAVDSYYYILDKYVLIKCIGVRGFPVCVKTCTVIYIALYDITEEIFLSNTEMMENRDIQIGEKH